MSRRLWIAGSMLAMAVAAPFVIAQETRSNFDRWWKPELDAVTAAPQNHKILFENDEVRVLEVSIPPHSQEPLHCIDTRR